MPEGDLELTSPLVDVPGISERLARDLSTLGLRAVGQLVAHLPHRHEREEPEAPIAELEPETTVSARGEITACRLAGFGKRARFEAVLHDGTGRLDLVWFNAPYLRGKLHPGEHIRVQGKAKRFKSGIQIANPRFEVIDPDDEGSAEVEARLRPVYPASERVSSRAIELAVQRILPIALPLIDDHLPEALRKERNLPELREAYRAQHAPSDEDEVAASRRRLAYDELLLMQLGVAMKRHHLRDTQRAPALRSSDAVHRRIRDRLPFELTKAQSRVVGELTDDLTRDVPTNRMIQGDVGSGKTMVALYAMLLAVESGHQAAMMAPTEILAEQHFESISSTLGGDGPRVELLTGAASDADRASILRGLASGEIDLLIGTHALLTESVVFKSLAVAIIDEQHRFGVHQRSLLRSKGESGGQDGEGLTPHVVVMTATPIPRTLSLTLFGDLDVSTIDQLPPGRQPIETATATPDDRGEVYARVRSAIEAGDQAYVVVPAIDANDEIGLVGVREITHELETRLLDGVRIATVHGRLKRATREHIMERFRRGLIDVLVATTVIEVGVDVPNATVMVVEQADRFGLAQLHQLRGRVGRGSKPSWCCLVSDPKTPDGAERLRVLTESRDGFRIAERDFELRGPGEIFGARQSGIPPFRVADLAKDTDLLILARRDAQDWVNHSPTLSNPNEQILRRRVLKTHGTWIGLGDVG